MKYKVGDIIEFSSGIQYIGERFYVLNINQNKPIYPYRLKLLTGDDAGYITNWRERIEIYSELVKEE